MSKIVRLGLVALVCVALVVSPAFGAKVFFSEVGTVGGGVDPVADMDLQVFANAGDSTTLYIWSSADQNYDTSIGMNVRSATAGVIAFNSSVVENPEILSMALGGVPAGVPRWWEVANGVVTQNAVTQMNAVTVHAGTGITSANNGTTGLFKYLDPLYDVAAGAFLLGSVSLDALAEGSTTLSIDQTDTWLFMNAGNAISPQFGTATINGELGPPAVFLSEVGDVAGGVDRSVVPEIDLTPGSSGSLWVWVTDEQPVDTTFALDAFSDTPGVIDFAGAEVLNADVTVDGVVVDTRWQETGNGSVQPDGQCIRNFVGVAVTDGTGLDPSNNGVGGGLLDGGYDVAAGAFLFARVDFDVIGEGVTNLSFGEGGTLIVHAGVDVADRFDLGTNKAVITILALGDVNRDGVVDGLDVDPFIDELIINSTNPQADMNKDGFVNGLDVAPFVAAVIAGSTQAVPEPTTLALATLALLGLLCWRRAGR